MARIVIGIPMFGDVSQEVYEDHCRMFYYLGRRYPEHEFFLACKTKSEQFRARNAIVQAARQLGADYLLMLDDDMIVNPDFTTTPTPHYEFLRRMLEHLRDNPDIGICGALYWQRGNDCFPVMLRDNGQGGFRFFRPDEVTGYLQDVDVAGGGCLLINMRVFDRLTEPWFAPEFEYGTDVQICTKARAAGWRVCVDSGIELGHVESRRRVVTSKNRHEVFADAKSEQLADALQHDWYTERPVRQYVRDAVEYLGLDEDTIRTLAKAYRERHFKKMRDVTDAESLRAYYVGTGVDQLCRQVYYHQTAGARAFMRYVLQVLMPGCHRVLDFACGSAPIGFELARKGDDLVFVDIDGASGFEFLKWRLAKYNVRATVMDSREFFRAAAVMEPFQAILLADALEHFPDWQRVCDCLDSLLPDGGAILTNFFAMGDDPDNVEHVSMDRPAVEAYLKQRGIYQVNCFTLIKNLDVLKSEQRRTAH